jgi:hypothetical protein
VNEEELIQKTRELIGSWDNVRIVGLGWSGDPRRGFQFNPTDVRTGGGGSGGTPPPPTTSGACCPAEGDCFIATQTICEDGGGTYQGDSTTCDPDPCPTMLPCNGCGFDAFDGSGRKFLRKDYLRIGRFEQSRVGDPPCAEITISAGVDAADSQVIDNLDCSVIETSSASSYYHPTGFSTPCDDPSTTDCWDNFMAGLDTAYLFCADCDGTGAVYTDSGVVTDSATMQHRYQTATGPDCTEGYDNETWTLSDECVLP